MRFFLLVLLYISITSSAFAVEIGQKIEIQTQDHEPIMGVQYAYDIDFVWSFTLTLWGPDLTNGVGVSGLAWRLYDDHSKMYLIDWETIESHPNKVYYTGAMAYSLSVEGKESVLSVIKAMKSLKVVFSVNGQGSSFHPTKFIDLGSYCQSSPDKFINLTTFASGCEL